MRLSGSILRTVLAVALAAYAFDCSAATTQQEAMQCCNSMHCSSHGHHGQDCCKTMPSTHGPFVQLSSGHSTSVAAVMFTVAPELSRGLGLEFSPRSLLAQCHAPPGLQSVASQPLHI